ncbi:MAG: hypothetical protein JWN74_1748 [Acidobacteriaceae bacterium]|nr:hypothetical protein [Acidobacteriaceae bacterium]
MGSPSPTAAGFRLILRRPTIVLAEIAWRWSFAVAVWFLGGAFLLQYAGSLSVNSVDRLLLGTRQPVLILRALHRIFHGSALRFTTSGILLAIALTIAWIALASLGRAATLKATMEELGITPSPNTRRGTIFSLFALNFLRAATTLAAVVAGFGAVLIASGVWASTHLSAGDAARLWLALLLLVWISWATLNWLLSTSALFVAADGIGAFPAISATVGWYRDRRGSVLAVGTWFGLIHGGAFLTACGAGFTVLGMAAALGPGPTLFLEFLILAVYSAVADALYIGRLTAYLATIRGAPAYARLPQAPLPTVSGSGRASIDQSELILSDVPLPAT